MADYDPNALNEQAESVDTSQTIEAEITEINQDVAYNIFGEDTQSEPDKEMIIVISEYEMDGETNEVETIFALPTSKKSWLNPRFGLARFKSRYGQAPEVGMSVELKPDENGFLDISMPDRAVIDAD